MHLSELQNIFVNSLKCICGENNPLKALIDYEVCLGKWVNNFQLIDYPMQTNQKFCQDLYSDLLWYDDDIDFIKIF